MAILVCVLPEEDLAISDVRRPCLCPWDVVSENLPRGLFVSAASNEALVRLVVSVKRPQNPSLFVCPCAASCARFCHGAVSAVASNEQQGQEQEESFHALSVAPA